MQATQSDDGARSNRVLAAPDAGVMVHPVFGRGIGFRWRHLRASLRHGCSVEHDRVESHASNGKTGVVIEDESDDVGGGRAVPIARCVPQSTTTGVMIGPTC